MEQEVQVLNSWEELKKLHPVIDRKKFPEAALCFGHGTHGNGMIPVEADSEYFESDRIILQCPYCNGLKRINVSTEQKN